MNLLHLKYAVEIASTGSITRAAENLYTSQPNLSRAVRELETSLGVEIFTRTPKGIYPTAQGEEFLSYARSILSQVDTVENMYRQKKQYLQRFSVSAPRTGYISCAFTEFAKKANAASSEFIFRETNSVRAISNLVNNNYNLAILRYQSKYEPNFADFYTEKGLLSDLLCEFKPTVTMSASHPLAKADTLSYSDLLEFTELAQADPFVPLLPADTVRKGELTDGVSRRIFIFERASAFDLLNSIEGAFMWGAPLPQRLLDAGRLVQKRPDGETRIYRDVLVCKDGYQLTELDRQFLDELKKIAPI